MAKRYRCLLHTLHLTVMAKSKLEKYIELIKGSTRLQAIIGDLTDPRGNGFENISRQEIRQILDLPDIIEVPETLDYDLIESSFEVIDQPGLTKTVMMSLIESRKRIGGTFEVFPEHFADKVSIGHAIQAMESGSRFMGLPEMIAFIKNPHNRAKSKAHALLACEKVKVGDVEYIFASGYSRGKSTLYVIPDTRSKWDVGTVFLQCKRIQP